MNVKELIKELKLAKDKQQEIFIAVDEEGNDFRPICGVCIASGEKDMNDEPIKGFIIYPT